MVVWSLVVWSLVIGHWSLVPGHWSLVIGLWSLVIASVVTGHCVCGYWSTTDQGPATRDQRPISPVTLPTCDPAEDDCWRWHCCACCWHGQPPLSSGVNDGGRVWRPRRTSTVRGSSAVSPIRAAAGPPTIRTPTTTSARDLAS